MAVVVLDRVWLSEAADPSVSTSFFSTGRSDQRSTAGELRAYANGRLRVVTRAVSTLVMGVTAVSLTPAQLAQLDGWRGSVLLFRDVWGRAVYGTYLALDVADAADRSGQDVTFTFQQVTYSPAV